MDDTARLTLHRRSPQDEGERLVFASLDGERLGPLAYGKTLERPLAPGAHRLRVHNTFAWKTVTFEAAPGQDVHFGVVNIAPGCMVGIAAAIGAAPMFVKIVPGPPEADPPSSPDHFPEPGAESPEPSDTGTPSKAPPA